MIKTVITYSLLYSSAWNLILGYTKEGEPVGQEMPSERTAEKMTVSVAVWVSKSHSSPGPNRSVSSFSLVSICHWCTQGCEGPICSQWEVPPSAPTPHSLGPLPNQRGAIGGTLAPLLWGMKLSRLKITKPGQKMVISLSTNTCNGGLEG